MANNRELFTAQKQQHGNEPSLIETQLERIQYDAGYFSLLNIKALTTERFYVQLEFHKSAQSRLPELIDTSVDLVISSHHPNTFFYALMDALLQLSRRYVEQHFCYRGFNRFSRDHCVDAIAGFSSTCRNFINSDSTTESFENYLHLNNSIDASRAPHMKASKYARHTINKIDSFAPLHGYLPTLKEP